MSDKAINPSVKKPSFEDYLTTERPGASRDAGRSVSNRWHNLLVSNTAIALGSRMHGHKAEIYISNMRVKLKNGNISYPDVVLVNGEPQFADANADLLLNPTVVFEIIPRNTNSSDKAQMLESFLAMDSIKECVMLKEDEMRAEHYARQNAKQWIYRIYNERDDVVGLESVQTKISLSEIYAQIKFQGAAISSGAVN
ncbi:MAG TPA: Uma2 family endonuclease [Pyrinomonadaceae bacterium]|nr:Uma2 family endonuclease [Pyrinomonadaceae bacterium]